MKSRIKRHPSAEVLRVLSSSMSLTEACRRLRIGDLQLERQCNSPELWAAYRACRERGIGRSRYQCAVMLRYRYDARRGLPANDVGEP